MRHILALVIILIVSGLVGMVLSAPDPIDHLVSTGLTFSIACLSYVAGICNSTKKSASP